MIDTLMQWIEAKRDLVALTGLDRDALHIYAAVAVQAGTAAALRRRFGDWLPLMAVAGLALLNEAADVYVDVWPDHALQASKSIHDLVNTMFLPTIIFVLSRCRPSYFTRT